MVNLLFLLGDVLEEGFIGIILTLDTLILNLFCFIWINMICV